MNIQLSRRSYTAVDLMAIIQGLKELQTQNAGWRVNKICMKAVRQTKAYVRRFILERD